MEYFIEKWTVVEDGNPLTWALCCRIRTALPVFEKISAAWQGSPGSSGQPDPPSRPIRPLARLVPVAPFAPVHETYWAPRRRPIAGRFSIWHARLPPTMPSPTLSSPSETDHGYRLDTPAANPDYTHGQRHRGPEVKRRHWRWMLVLAVLAVIVWLLPGIVVHTPLLRWILGKATADLNGTVTVQSASLGWFSPIAVEGVEVKDAQGKIGADAAGGQRRPVAGGHLVQLHEPRPVHPRKPETVARAARRRQQRGRPAGEVPRAERTDVIADEDRPRAWKIIDGSVSVSRAAHRPELASEQAGRELRHARRHRRADEGAKFRPICPTPSGPANSGPA